MISYWDPAMMASQKHSKLNMGISTLPLKVTEYLQTVRPLKSESSLSRTKSMIEEFRSEFNTEHIPEEKVHEPGPMFKFQQTLPRLPVPSLHETMEKYLRTVEPLLKSSEFARTKAAVEEFMRPGGWGETLQNRLLSRANDPNIANWLEDWLNESMYFGFREPLPFYSNYYYVFRDDPKRASPAARAASIVTAALEFRRLVVTEKLEPEHIMREPLCMSTYKWLFNSCRVPDVPSDYERRYDPSIHNHIIVIRQNKFYAVDVMQNGKQLSAAELESQFQYIMEHAGKERDMAISVLTADDRDVWTENRRHLVGISQINESNLYMIESSIFTLCLDDTRPVTPCEISRALWYGDGGNRYHDKSFQLVVFENGKAGFIGEHSSMDGMITLRMCKFICQATMKHEMNWGTIRKNLRLPSLLQFELNEKFQDIIFEAQWRFDIHASKHDVKVLTYEKYGKERIKNFRVSPDAYAQMVMQLAYYRVHGEFPPTYESATHRKFQGGRTESCRTLSVDSVKFVKSMCDPKATDIMRAELCRRACKTHTKYMIDCFEGRSIDRHLLGLRKSLLPNEPLPSLFADPAYYSSSHYSLSTSQLSCEHFDGYGWGETVPDGYAVAYSLNNKFMHFNIACLKTMQAEKMHQAIKEAADDMLRIFERELKLKAKAKL
ncbi:uncharacterized protein VTP21DRAFT_1794 [Calcarisporiella thermophila]|uniref:uncharacterized protein n=1 Tax=Calcarisporiella thermophila TaxID=911321 RepID=UPI003744A027